MLLIHTKFSDAKLVINVTVYARNQTYMWLRWVQQNGNKTYHSPVHPEIFMFFIGVIPLIEKPGHQVLPRSKFDDLVEVKKKNTCILYHLLTFSINNILTNMYVLIGTVQCHVYHALKTISILQLFGWQTRYILLEWTFFNYLSENSIINL